MISLLKHSSIITGSSTWRDMF